MKTIYLSPSTQEKNVGVNGYGTEEVYANGIADRVQAILEQAGVKIRRNRPEMTLGQVVVDSNRSPVDLHLAIHTNAMGGASIGKARGAEVFIHRKGGRAEQFARILYERLAAITPSADRGIKEGYQYFGPGKPLYETAYTTAPAALVEIAFHDNPEDVAWLLTHQEEIAFELAASVLTFLGLPIPAPLDVAGAVDRINKLLTDNGEQPLSTEYWPANAVQGKPINGAWAGEALLRIARCL